MNIDSGYVEYWIRGIQYTKEEYISNPLNGVRVWKKDGKKHREDGPAVIFDDGDKMWFYEGEKHREDGPAVIVEGASEWYHHGILHREDGPAMLYADGSEYWFLHGKRHNLNGPAVIIKNPEHKEYWIHGVQYSENEFGFWVEMIKKSLADRECEHAD